MTSRRQLGVVALRLAACGALGGCGFHPLYAENSRVDAPAALGEIFVARIPERTGQELRQALQARLDGSGSASRKRFELTASYFIEQQTLSIQQDNSSTRSRLIGHVSWLLRSDIPQAPIITSGFARALDGNNIVDEQFFYADLQTAAAQQRLAGALADQVTQQLAVYFEQHPNAA